MTYLKLLGYVILINVLRYFPGGWIESVTIFEPMHAPMADYPDCFGFTEADLPSSLFYNFCLWLIVIILFHIAHPAIKGKMIYKSLLIFGLCGAFFISLAAVYMNHFTEGIRTFFRYSMIDGLILFTYLGIINALLYPVIFKSLNQQNQSLESPS